MEQNLIAESITEAEKLDKEIFLAEYKSLRDEILLRITQQTNVTHIAFTVWAAITAVAIKSGDSPNLTHFEGLFNTIYILLIYPILAFFISFSWAFHNSRICHIGKYLRNREKKISESFGLLQWEGYIYEKDSCKNMAQTNKISSGITIFVGTQGACLFIAAIILGLIILYHYHPQLIPIHVAGTQPNEVNNPGSYLTSFILAVFFLVVDAVLTYFTYFKIKNSNS